MNIKLPTFFFKRLASMLSLLILMSLFQNCGTSEDSISDALNDFEAQRADSLPFAFDMSVDHIAYMSCEHTDILKDSTSHFNFKVGAYNDDEGLKFRTSFIDSSVVGELQNNKEQLLEYLSQSKRNSGAGVVMSIRESGQFRGPVTIGSSQVKTDFVSPMLWDLPKNVQLAETRISNLIFENPLGLNYLSGFSGTRGKTFETQLSFNGIGAQNLLRSSLEGEGYLALTFGTNDLEELGVKARSPFDTEGNLAAVNNSVFGKGYKLSFVQQDSTRQSSPRVAVSTVQGFNLENESSLDESWICPESERYIIMRNVGDALRRFDAAPALKDGQPNDPTNEDDPGTPGVDESYDDGGQGVGGYYMELLRPDIDDPSLLVKSKQKVLCPTIPDEMLSGQAEHTDPAWKRVRSVLSSDEWYVFRGDRYNCIVPKKNDNACYGKFDDTDNPLVQYFADEDFVENKIENAKRVENGQQPIEIPVRIDCEGDGTESRLCPHVLSICHKL